MGCDGGSIPKRHEIVKTKQKETRDKNADLQAKFQFCDLSGMRLKKPIVACRLGHLYNKDAIIEHLLESKSTSSSASPSQISHIRSLKDVKELTLKSVPNSNTDPSSSKEKSESIFICPISSLGMNGKYRFFFSWTCGCVFSERALKEVPNEKECILCNKPYETEDLIILNGDEEEIKELKSRLINHRRKQKSAKRESKDCEQSTSRSHRASSDRSDLDHKPNNKRQRVESIR